MELGLQHFTPAGFKAFLAVIFFFWMVPAQAQRINSNWETDLQASLQQFMNCQGHGSGVTPCSKYLGESLNTVYKVNDFYSQKLGRYMLVDEINDYVSKSGQWKLLGHAYEQGVLNTAQSDANAKKAVVAVYISDGNVGHVALILPGELQPSGSWGVSVPNAASFLLSSPERSFINKGLSYAFTKAHLKDLLIYERTY